MVLGLFLRALGGWSARRDTTKLLRSLWNSKSPTSYSFRVRILTAGTSHGEGDRDSQFVKVEYQQIRDTIKMELEASRKPWAELFKGSNRRRVVVAACVGLFSQWSGNGLVAYFLAKILASIGITDRAVQNRINLGLSCWNLVAAAGGSFITKVLPRRTQYLIAFVGMTLAFSCWTGASAVYAGDGTNGAAAKAVVALIFVYNGFYGLMMPLTYLFITELFPFIHRSKGVAITQFFTRGPNAFNQFVNPIALNSIGWHYYIVYVAWLAVETGIIFFVYPETKGPSLEEVAFVVDGTEAKVAIIDGQKVMHDSETAITSEVVVTKAD